MKEYTGTIAFASDVQATLWDACITGQLSDGYWENSRPYDHWRFWCSLQLVTGSPGVVAAPYKRCLKNNYNLKAIKEFVLDDLLKTGRMAIAANSVLTYELGRAALYMPPTLDEFLTKKEKGGFAWQYEYVAKTCQFFTLGMYMESVSVDLARAYYAAKYTVRDLNKDLTAIKEVMKTAPKW